MTAALIACGVVVAWLVMLALMHDRSTAEDDVARFRRELDDLYAKVLESIEIERYAEIARRMTVAMEGMAAAMPSAAEAARRFVEAFRRKP